MTSALLLIWGSGLAHSIRGGLNPGYVRHAATRPYPVRAIFFTCGVITAEFVALLATLPPFSLSGHRRVLVALGVFVPLWIADFVFMNGWTDQAGYCYSNGTFLLFTDAFLSVTGVVAFCYFGNDHQRPLNARHGNHARCRKALNYAQESLSRFGHAQMASGVWWVLRSRV